MSHTYSNRLNSLVVHFILFLNNKPLCSFSLAVWSIGCYHFFVITNCWGRPLRRCYSFANFMLSHLLYCTFGIMFIHMLCNSIVDIYFNWLYNILKYFWGKWHFWTISYFWTWRFDFNLLANICRVCNIEIWS